VINLHVHCIMVSKEPPLFRFTIAGDAGKSVLEMSPDGLTAFITEVRGLSDRVAYPGGSFTMELAGRKRVAEYLELVLSGWEEYRDRANRRRFS
jgi:hypothetical protein